jgi:hypothetical protein
MGEMKCIFNIGQNISIWAKVTQVSDVAHGPLVCFFPPPLLSVRSHRQNLITYTYQRKKTSKTLKSDAKMKLFVILQNTWYIKTLACRGSARFCYERLWDSWPGFLLFILLKKSLTLTYQYKKLGKVLCFGNEKKTLLQMLDKDTIWCGQLI